MVYATVSDLITRYGGRELAEVLDSVTEQDVVITEDNYDYYAGVEAEINAAIRDAQAVVEPVVLSIYTDPLQYDGEELDEAPNLLTSLVCDIARYYLHDDKVVTDGQTDPVVSRYIEAMKTLDKLKSGDTNIPADKINDVDDVVYHI